MIKAPFVDRLLCVCISPRSFSDSRDDRHSYLFGFRRSVIKQQEYQRDVSAVNSSESGYYNKFNVTLA